MYKLAEIITQLQPHQQAALNKALVKNLILAHSTGSGKTLTSIAIADKLGKPTTVLTPASLVQNYKKQLLKHKKGGPPVEVLSLPTAVQRDYQIPLGNTLIVDQAHALRNQGTAKQQYIKNQLNRVGRVFGLTGTPAYNNLADWAPLVNIVAKKQVFPDSPQAFKQRYIEEVKSNPGFWARLIHNAKQGVVQRLKNKEELRNKLQPFVDVVQTDRQKPARIDQTIEVPMKGLQQQVYKGVTDTLPSNLKWKLQNNLPPSKQQSKSLNAFYSGARQIANTPQGFYVGAETGQKLKRAAKQLIARARNNKGFRALVYSTYLGSGIQPYGKLLDKEGLKYSIFNGSLSPKQKKAIVDKYNSGEVPIILGSGSASQGLDLKDTRLIQILEPHFNNAKVDQVIGRGIRYKSHDDLPPQQRNVTVQRFISTLPQQRNWFGKLKDKQASVDEYLTSRAEQKQRLVDEVKKILSVNKG